MKPDLGEESKTNKDGSRTNEDRGTRDEINAIPTKLIGLSTYYSHEWQVLIYNIYKTSVNGEFIENHYKSNHKSLKKKERDQFIKRITALKLVISTPNSVRTPKPLEIYCNQLWLWADYLACDKCNDVVAKSEKFMDIHYNRVHNIKLNKRGARTKRAKPYLAGLQIQSFFNKHEKWFITNTPHNRAILQPNTAEFTEIEPHDQLNVLINEKNAYYQRLEAENERLTDTLFADTDPKHIHQFLIRFHWRFWLRGKSIAKLTELGVTPTENDQSGNFLLKLSRIGWKKVENLLVEPPSRFILQIVNTQRFKDKGSEYEQRPFNALQRNATKEGIQPIGPNLY